MSLVKAKMAESHEISGLLADIFTEADAQPKTQAKGESKAQKKKSAAQPALVAGLDAPHSELLRSLAQQEIWPRPELIAIASRLDLMLDGALEVINELAFERTDEPVTEGEDEIEVNQTVLQELLG